MCNSSSNNSAPSFNELLNWYCICEGKGNTYALIILSLCAVVGMAVHCWSLWVFFHGNIKPSLVFPLNITLLELFFCIGCITDFITFIYPSKTYLFVIFLYGLVWTCKPLIQTYMCIEHYLAVCHPIMYRKYKSMQYIAALVAEAWLIALANSTRLIFIGVDNFPDHLFFLYFCIAVTIISFCCASVLLVLKRPGPGERINVEMTEKDGQKKNNRVRTVENQKNRKAFRAIFHILLSILFGYLPMEASYFMHLAKPDLYVYNCEAVPIILSFTLSFALISPLVRMYCEGHFNNIMCFSIKER